MADIARLGLQIEAKGVAETRAQLAGLSQTAAETASKFTSAASAVESAGSQIAGAPDGFLPFAVNAEGAAKRVDTSVKQLARSTAAAAVTMAELGPAGNAAANALQGLLLASGPVGLAMAALAAVIGFVSYRINEARRHLAELAEKELKALQKETDNLKLEQSVQLEIEALKSLDPELTRIRIKYREMANEAAKAGAREQAIAKIHELEALEVKKLTDTRSAAKAATDASQASAKKAAQELAAVKQQSALQAITDTLNETAVIAGLNQEIDRQRSLFDQGAASAAALDRNLSNLGRIKATFDEIKGAADNFFKTGIAPGTQALQDQLAKIAEVESQARKTYGVNIPASVQTAIDRMRGFVNEVAKATGTDLEKLKNAAPQIGIGASFTPSREFEFLRKDLASVEAVTTDLGQGLALVNGVITNMSGPVEAVKTDIAATGAAVDGMRRGIEQSGQATQRFGETTAKQAAEAEDRFATMSSSVELLNEKARQLIETVSQKLALTMDTSGANAALDAVQRQLNGIIATIQQINSTPVQVVQ
jgi:hypothetical protein